VIKMNSVSMIYPDGTKGLSDLTLRISVGEFVFITGPSGAGKSTLLKLLLREYIPTQGHIYINGRNINRLPHYSVPYFRRQLGVVFQDFKLLPRKTVIENVGIALQIKDRTVAEDDSRIQEALEIVGLWHKATKFPNQLSGGEQQRVAIARALVRKPMILLADEPTGNLDVEATWMIMELFKFANKNGTTVVIATHNEEIIRRYKSRVITFNEGRLVSDIHRSPKSCRISRHNERRLTKDAEQAISQASLF
jgi:cell division transport system ATP-binding protein